MHILVENIRQLIIDKQEILIEKLNFGACDASIDAFKSRINLELPEIFYDFYCLFNGCASSGTLVWAKMTLMPLSAILKEKTQLDKLYLAIKKEEKPTKTIWKPNYLPFLSDNSDSLICIDTSVNLDGKVPHIILWSRNDSKIEILFESFENWLKAWFQLLQSFDKDIIVNREEFISFCEQNIVKIAQSINSEFPKIVDIGIQQF